MQSKKVYQAESDFLLWLGELHAFPYFWTQKYSDLDIHAYFDESKNMVYFLHNSRKLYFPTFMDISVATSTYRFLQLENDQSSPHRYFTDSFKISLGDILFDIGAAEAWVTLDHIDLVTHAYIFESDPNWIEALNATFEPYKEKVTIINKFASNIDGKDTIKLDSVFAETHQNILLKLDVEGAEQEVLSGAQHLIYNNKAKIVVCTYHKPNDYLELKRYFENLGYATQTTDGFMLYPPCWNMDKLYGTPSLRKGLLRCWKREHYPYVSESASSLYYEESKYEELEISKHISKCEELEISKNISNQKDDIVINRQKRHLRRYLHAVVILFIIILLLAYKLFTNL